MKHAMKVGEPFNPYGNFVGSFIPNSLMRFTGLGASEKLLWGRLAQYAGRGGDCYPRMETLAEEIGMSLIQVKRMLKTLVSHKFIKKETPEGSDRLKHKTCRYFFLWHPVFEKELKNPDAES